MQDILINWAPQETRVALVEHGAVQELHVERTLERGLVGNVYLGKVARVLPGMQSAFVDIGLERAAFLHVADVWHAPAPGESLSQARAQATSISAAPLPHLSNHLRISAKSQMLQNLSASSQKKKLNTKVQISFLI